MKKLSNFIQWLKPSFEGEDNKVSHRKLTVFFFCLVLLYMVVMTAYGAIFPEIAWICISSGAGLMSALKTYQNIRHDKVK